MKLGVGWCLIPPYVLADKSLKANEKLIYGRINGLTDKYGFCNASNAWLGEQLSIKADTVSKLISTLKNSGYLSIQMVYGENNQVKERRIYVQARKDKYPIPPVQISDRGIGQISEVSNRDKSNREEIYSTSFKNINDLTESVLQEIADHYSLSLTDVTKKKESMYLWLEEQPSRYLIKGKRRNLKMTLMNWIRRDLDSKKLTRKQTSVVPDLPELTQAEREANLERIAQMRSSLMGGMR